MNWTLIVSILIVFVAAILLLKYLDGGFTYEETVESEREYKRTQTNLFEIGTPSVDYIRRVVFKRKYQNGRIKFVTKEYKV